MARTVHRLQQARNDIDDIYFFIAADNPSAAVAFLDCVDNLLDLIADEPHMAPIRRFKKLGDVHVTPLSAPYENYLLFYRVQENVIEVPRVLHGARWKVISDFFGKE